MKNLNINPIYIIVGVLALVAFRSPNDYQNTNKLERVITVTGSADMLVPPDEILVDISYREYWFQHQHKNKGKESGWLITLDYPSYIPFMKYADNRKLRKQLNEAFGARGFNDNDYNNESIIAEIVSLRLAKAKLLGYTTYANFVLEERMAETPAKVFQLWDELLEVALPKAQSEIEEIKALIIRLEEVIELEAWDFSYYAEKLKNEKFAINDEILKPYFKLENVLDGAFQAAEKLYDITFHDRKVTSPRPQV